MKKRIVFDIATISSIVLGCSLIINVSRTDGLPLFLHHPDKNLFRTERINDFNIEDCNNFTCLLFDARPNNLYKKYHLPNAKNFPITEFSFFYNFYFHGVPKDAPVIIYGRTISKAFDLELAYLLHKKGHKNITVLL